MLAFTISTSSVLDVNTGKPDTTKRPLVPLVAIVVVPVVVALPIVVLALPVVLIVVAPVIPVAPAIAVVERELPIDTVPVDVPVLMFVG